MAGGLDTVHDTEAIKWELWKVVYGVWDYIKNSGEHTDVDTLTLEWVGAIPGKRESRRFEGDYILRQQDIVEQRCRRMPSASGGGRWICILRTGCIVRCPLYAISFKGGLFHPLPHPVQQEYFHLFLAGRIISTSHVAFCLRG